jgi:hypothetical protein
MKVKPEWINYGMFFVLAALLLYVRFRPSNVARQDKNAEANRALMKRLFNKTET